MKNDYNFNNLLAWKGDNIIKLAIISSVIEEAEDGITDNEIYKRATERAKGIGIFNNERQVKYFCDKLYNANKEYIERGL